jgi:threonine/homoserine/homoserine lactone efflux protein
MGWYTKVIKLRDLPVLVDWIILILVVRLSDIFYTFTFVLQIYNQVFMTEPQKEQSKAQKVIGAVFGLIGLAGFCYLIYLGVKLLIL